MHEGSFAKILKLRVVGAPRLLESLHASITSFYLLFTSIAPAWVSFNPDCRQSWIEADTVAMALLPYLPLFILYAPLAIAQEDDRKVWAAVAYINNGEKTPSLGSLNEALTPLGAQQLYRQGTAFRTRYLNTSANEPSRAQIAGLETEWIDNRQIDALVAEDEWVVAGALAFFQGLYPPAEGYSDVVGGNDFGRNLMSENQSSAEWVQFPMEGYQYPQLQTLSSLDSESPAVQGTVGCDAWMEEVNIPLKSRKDMQELHDNTLDFYADLTNGPLKGTADEGFWNFWNAWEIYEFVNYMYGHNQTVHDGLENANDTIAKLEENALKLQEAKNQEPDNGSNEENELYTIAGRTLAMRVADQLQRNLDWDGKRDKFSVIFGSHEPILSFLSVGDLLTRENVRSGPFTRLPQPGASLIFELIGEPTDSQTPPDANELSIRFLYRASADEAEEFEGYSLFNSGYGGKSIPYSAFYDEMTEAGVTSDDWCGVCSPTNAPWCHDLNKDGSDEKSGENGDGSGDGILTSNSRLHPALAGLIGALVMGFVVSVAALALFLLGGFRIARKSPEERRSTGGYRERKGDDPDIAVGADGERQERVGSWEMRDGEGDHVGFAKGLGISDVGVRDVNGDKTGDGESVFGAQVVRPRESV